MVQALKSAAPPAGARSPSAEQLLDAAIELIAQHGYAGMSVEALCRKAGIVKSGLYWHFGSKEGLLRAVIDRVTNEWIEEIQRNAYQGGGALERLDRTLAELQRRFTKSPEGLRVLLVVLVERAAVDPESQAALKSMLDRAQHAFVKGIIDAVGLEVPDLDVVGGLLLAMCHGVFLQYLTRQDEQELTQLFRGVREAILLLVRKRISEIPNSAPASNSESALNVGNRIAEPRGVQNKATARQLEPPQGEET